MNKCNLVADLLPLYLDGLLSEDSKQLVENHLSRCADCAKRAKLLAGGPEIPKGPVHPTEEGETLKRAKKKFRKKTLLAAAATFVAAIVVFSAVFFPVWFTAEAREKRRKFEQYVLGQYYNNEPELLLEEAIDVVHGQAGEDPFRFTADATGSGTGTALVMPRLTDSPSFLSVVTTCPPAWNISSSAENDPFTTFMNVSVKAEPDKTKEMCAAGFPVIRQMTGYDGGTGIKTLVKLLNEASVATCTELAAFVFGYDYNVSPDSSLYGEIEGARGAHDVMRWVFHIYGGVKTYRYFPIRGDLNGFAILLSDKSDFAELTVCLQKEDVLWTIDATVNDKNATKYFTGEREALRAFLNGVSFE